MIVQKGEIVGQTQRRLLKDLRVFVVVNQVILVFIVQVDQFRLNALVHVASVRNTYTSLTLSSATVYHLLVLTIIRLVLLLGFHYNKGSGHSSKPSLKSVGSEDVHCGSDFVTEEINFIQT